MIMLNAKMIGNKIAEARKRINISQAELAQQLSISPQAVGKWERGESMPDITTLNRLAEFVGVDLNYFSENVKSTSLQESSIEPPVMKSTEISSDMKKMNLDWNMSHGNWVDADFSGLKNLHEKFNSSNMQRCKFIGSDLSGLLLKNNNVDSCDFSNSNISNSSIQRSNLLKNLFNNCSLKGIDFSYSNIERCNFSNANLAETKFLKSFIYGCDLTDADFTGVVMKMGGFSGIEKSKDPEQNTIVNAIWNRTSFIDTQVADLNFTGTLQDCYFENCKFTRVKFKNATLLNTFFKNNSNLKRIEFIDCRADRITYEFLKQGKANLKGISMLPE
jgi:uncharacterized protein YjbI with pentapeptide repeats